MKLYKYVDPDRVDILRNGTIRFTQPEYLNDPFDVRPDVEQVRSDRDMAIQRNRLASALGRTRLADKFARDDLEQETRALPPGERAPMTRRERRKRHREHLKRVLKTPSFNQLHRDAVATVSSVVTQVNRETAKEIPKLFNESVGVLSLAERADNELMWSHYARGHAGFVLEFDGSSPFFDYPDLPGESALKKVGYREHQTLPYLFDNDVLVDPEQLFHVKNLQWEYEEEWRMLRQLEDADETKVLADSTQVCLYKLPPSCVTGVIFGARISVSNRAKVLEVLREDRYRHVDVYQARVGRGTIEIVPFKVKG